MKSTRMLLAILITFGSLLANYTPTLAQKYDIYHQQVIQAEKLMADKRFHAALLVYEQIFNSYDFVFLREYQLATQLALQENSVHKAMLYLKRGIMAGWSIKSIKKNKFLAKLFNDTAWKSLRKEYPTLRKQYEARLDLSLRKQVKKMFVKDQWKALGALLTFSPKGQDTYAERKFAPHSERQIAQLISILQAKGFPGEKSIGNNYWMATILAHHNSISSDYNRKDTLYFFLKPMLLSAISEGKMSPGEFAMIDDWYLAVSSNRTAIGYGHLTPVTQAEVYQVNELRQRIGLCPVETRNRLADIETETGMHLYMPGKPWLDGKIVVKD